MQKTWILLAMVCTIIALLLVAVTLSGCPQADQGDDMMPPENPPPEQMEGEARPIEPGMEEPAEPAGDEAPEEAADEAPEAGETMDEPPMGGEGVPVDEPVEAPPS